MPRTARLAEARARLEQLAQRLIDLRAGTPVSGSDLASASEQASMAAAHALQALRSSAAAHERAARSHEVAALHNCGDVVAHQHAAADHRAARDADSRAAEAAQVSAWSGHTHRCVETTVAGAD